MRTRTLLLLGILILGGCAYKKTTLCAMPTGPNDQICKHCNCLMPAGIPPDQICPVCDCKKVAAQCYRIKKQQKTSKTNNAKDPV